MGYLQSIKSADAYVKVMRAFMFRMPEVERDEACEEVRQHLAALIEDHQAEGHSSQEALRLAVQQFGPPFKVGLQIERRWEAGKRRQIEVSQPALARCWKRLFFLLCLIVGSGVFLIMQITNGWLALVFSSAVYGLLSGSLVTYLTELDKQVYGVPGVEWKEARTRLQEAQPMIADRISRSRSLRVRLDFLARQYAIKYLLNRKDNPLKPTALPKNILSALLLGVALGALILWSPVGHETTYLRKLMIFLIVSMQTQGLGRVLMNRWRQNRTA